MKTFLLCDDLIADFDDDLGIRIDFTEDSRFDLVCAARFADRVVVDGVDGFIDVRMGQFFRRGGGIVEFEYAAFGDYSAVGGKTLRRAR